MTKSDYLLSGALALLVAWPTTDASAQTARRTPTAMFTESAVKVKPAQTETRQSDFLAKHPLLGKVKMFGMKTSTPNRGEREMKADYQRLNGAKATVATAKRPQLATAEGRELWGCVAYQSTWASGEAPYGVYSFNAASPITVTAKALNDNMVATGGGALVDGIYHMVYAVESWGMIFMTYYAFDTNTWEQVAEADVEDYAMYGKETAVAADGTVYGEFYSSDLCSYELGVADYSSLTRTTIGTLENAYAAMGITSDNKIYGVASDGNLYRIDTKTAKETLVGATGVTIADEWGDYYGQSGEIDQKTNTFYWAAVNSNGESALYTIDLTTGAATKVADFPAEEKIYALSIPEPPIANAAPAAATDVAAAFDKASLTGVVSFTAPTKTFGGDELTGQLDYYIIVGGDTIGTGKTTAGAKTEATVTVGADGAIRFKVVTANGAGESPKATTTQHVGYDSPEASGSVKLDADDNTGKMTVKWTAPTTGANGGYIGDLRYDVVRYPDSVTVATSLTDTVFTETIEATELKAYTYGVVAVNDTKRGKEATSNKVVMGPGIVPPYENTFGSKDAFDLMSVIDANNDGCTWSLYTYSDGTGYARYSYSKTNKADDWLLTPPLKLESGKEYIVSFEAANYQSKYPETLEVKYGVGSDPTIYNGVLLEPTMLPSAQYTKYTSSIAPEADGSVKIGFHCTSDPYKYFLLLRNVTVSEGSSVAAPDSATSISAKAGAKGALEATVSFTLPSKAINGSDLTAIAKADILRDGAVVGSITDGLKPGATVSFTDANAASGKNTYSIRVHNANGGGRYSSEATVFVGPDKPEAVAADGIKTVDNTSAINLSWTPVATGVNGGYVNPDELWYNIYNVEVDKYGDTELSLIDSVQATTAYNIAYDTEEGDQRLVYFGLSARNAMGEGKQTLTKAIVCGKSHTLPYKEVFPGGKNSYASWWSTTPGKSYWGTVSKTSYDDLGGSAAFAGEGDAAYLATGKISLAGAATPKLVFRTKTDKKTDGSITVLVRRFDSTVDTVATISYNTMDSTAATPWTTSSVSLAKYTADPYVIVQFCGNGSTNGYIYIDDINVRNVPDNDLAATLSIPVSVKKGDNAAVNVKVTNYGDNTAEAYTVKLYAGNTLVEAKETTEPLASFDSKTFAFDYKTSIFDENDSVSLTATVEFDGDQNADNNTASASMQLQASTKAAPLSASAFISDDAVEVEWTAPETTKAETTEDFEGYATWAVDKFGDWTCYDGDKGNTGLVFDGYKYGHQGEAFAFGIWEPEAIFEGFVEKNPSFAPHSGNKYAAAVYSSVNKEFVDADNWLISPTLSGDAQTVKFYALNQGDAQNIYPEEVVLLYSTDGSTDTSKFIPVDTIVIDQDEWTEFSFDVPAGATNFAIRHTTKDGGFVLAIDDITYIAGIGMPIGYNIYRNGELVATVNGNASSYTDTAIQGDGVYKYAVTAVYDDGESAPVLASPVVITAIDGIGGANGKTYTVYSIDGKRVATGVKSLNGLKKGVYIINDKKAVVK